MDDPLLRIADLDKRERLAAGRYYVKEEVVKMDPLFEVHMLNDNGKQKALAIAAAFDKLLNELDGYMTEGRAASIVRTKLEEACFFAKKSMASAKENQQ